MEEAIIEVIRALAVRPELLAIIVLAVVLTVMLRRRAKTPKKQRQNGSPLFKLVISRVTLVMLVLSAVTFTRVVFQGVEGLAAIKAKEHTHECDNGICR